MPCKWNCPNEHACKQQHEVIKGCMHVDIALGHATAEASPGLVKREESFVLWADMLSWLSHEGKPKITRRNKKADAVEQALKYIIHN